MNTRNLFSLIAIAGGIAFTTSAVPMSKAAPLTTFARMPIKEITVFKDGHAFVAHEGKMPTDDKGNIVMDYLPTPVLGTFWPYSAEKDAPLVGVVAGQRRVEVERTALNLRELLEGNVGAEAIITEGTNRYAATIAGVPSRSAEELDATSPPNSIERLPEKGNLILLQTAEGLRAVSIDRISDVTFKGTPKYATANEEFRNLLTLKLDWGKTKPAKSARMGLFYVQKGMRWIPNYRVEIDGKGNAVVKFQATLLNELADLDDVALNLVIGVPTFSFKDTVDPMALQQSLAQLSQYFQTDNPRNSPLAYNFSNAIMSQQARASDYSIGVASSGGAGSLGPEIGDAEKTEDLFVFNVPHVTLRKGERMVFPIAEFTLPYKDVFTLDVPFTPPPELRQNFGSEQQRELARLFNAPKVMHKIRLTNNGKYPLTTAPALIVREGRVLAQGMMTYTSTGASVDVAITTAVDIQVKKSEVETKRTPNAFSENGNSYSRIDLSGQLSLTSHRAQPIEIEVTRFVLGTADSADRDGRIEKINAYENGDGLGSGDYPYWWGSYGWPYWWHYQNGVARVSWTVKLESQKSAELNYTWHYLWR
jgi:hypothetical protein